MQEYEEIEQIGKGVFSDVYLCRHAQTHRLVVDKRIAMTFLSAEDRGAVLEEARILDRFKDKSHPHVIHFIEFCTLKDTVHFYMEYCSGGSLEDELKQRKMQQQLYREREVLSCLYQMASGLAFIHKNKVVHRDLKPANILKTEEGTLKIADFGIEAVLAHIGSVRETKARTMRVVYMAPEVLEEDDDQSHNYKCDIWSLGVIIYELITLRLPFSAKNDAALMKKILASPFDPVNREINYQLQHLLTDMMSKSASDRPSSNSIVEMEFVVAAYQPKEKASIDESTKRKQPVQAASAKKPSKDEDPEVSKEFETLNEDWETSEEKNVLNDTLLHYCCRKGATPALVRMLINKGDNIEAKNESKKTPLYVACQEGHLVVAQTLVSLGANVEAAEKDGATPLYIACGEGHLLVARALISLGANVEAAENTIGATPLYIACHEGHLKVVRMLISLKANVEATTKYGATALHIACEKGHLEVAQAFIDHGVNANAKDRNGDTPATHTSNAAILALLKKK